MLKYLQKKVGHWLWQRIPLHMEAGIDMVFIPEIAQSISTFGDKFLNFIYTKKEIEYCRAHSSPGSYVSYAARMAAKEAVIKILRPTRHEVLPWRSIEIVRDGSEKTTVCLHGSAQKKAEEIGLAITSVSLSHEHDYATAIVLGVRCGLT